MKRFMLLRKGIPVIFVSTLALGTFFQNCSPVAFKSLSSEDGTSQSCEKNPALCPNPGERPTCTFNGNTYNEGDSITAYLSSSVPAGQSCQSEKRICKNGSFTGSYAYSTCAPGGYRSCLFNGITIAHGHTVQAFLNSSVAFGATCQSENRVCNDGILSGTYAYSSCSPGAPASCLFNGRTIAHNASVTAYPTSSVPFGQTCQSQVRVCNNGTLSGSGDFESCSPGAAASCLFNGTTVPHGGSVTAYQTSSVDYGQTCAAQTRTCNNGALSGTYQYSTCSVSSVASCLFNGQTIAHGQSVTAYASSSVPYGQYCSSQARTCNNGSLSGSYQYSSCSTGSAANCYFNGQLIYHGQGVTAYASSSVGYGQSCASQYRVCSNGTLSGSYQYSSCSAGTAANCNFNGQTVYHGQSVTAYASSSVPFGQSCSSESRTCNNGSLSGSYGYSSCSPGTAASCNWYGTTVPHGGSVTAYLESSVAYPRACMAQQRVCNNGTFSGSYGAASCTELPAASCTVYYSDAPPLTLQHGQTANGYERWGRSCAPRTVTCDNGVTNQVYAGLLKECQTIDAGSPLMIHFNSNVEKVEPLEFSAQIDGIIFDILGLNSTPVPYAPKMISWYKSSQYFFIALPNKFGKVKGIDQLFGDNTQGPDGKFAADGYEALAKYDGMSADGKIRLHAADGYITAKDPVFKKLRLWNDANYDGVAQSEELVSLDSKNIEIIDLNADPNFKETDKYGNETALKSVVKTKDGRYHLMFDIWFAYKDIQK